MTGVPWAVDLIKVRGGYRVVTTLAGKEVQCTATIPYKDVAEKTQLCIAEIMSGTEVKAALNAEIRRLQNALAGIK